MSRQHPESNRDMFSALLFVEVRLTEVIAWDEMATWLAHYVTNHL